MTTLFMPAGLRCPAMVRQGQRRDRQRLVGRDPRHPPDPLLRSEGRASTRSPPRSPSSTPTAGIRVVATAPGGTEAPPRRISRGTPEPRTEQERAWFQAHIDQTLESSLMSRYGTLDEQAAAICFLASEEASYITGTVLPVAGGDVG